MLWTVAMVEGWQWWKGDLSRESSLCRGVRAGTTPAPSRTVLASNSYTLGLSARSILIGRVKLPRGAVADTVAGTVADIHVFTQDLS